MSQTTLQKRTVRKVQNILEGAKTNAWDCPGASVSHCLSGRARPGTSNSRYKHSLYFMLLSMASTHLGLMSSSVEIWFISCDCLPDRPEQTYSTQQSPQHYEERPKTSKKLRRITSSSLYRSYNQKTTFLVLVRSGTKSLIGLNWPSSPIWDPHPPPAPGVISAQP